MERKVPGQGGDARAWNVVGAGAGLAKSPGWKERGAGRPLGYPAVRGERGGADGAPGGEVSGWDQQILKTGWDVAEVSVAVPSALPGRAGGVSGVE